MVFMPMVFTDQQPLVSIITSVRNGAVYLEDTIQSVLRQDYPNIEHIIIDDGSNDEGATVAILKRYPHLRWWSRENRGIYATLNEGFAAATGSILVNISADDMYVVPSAISAVVNYWQSHPSLGCIYGRLLYVDKDGLPLPVQMHPAGPWPTWLLRYVFFTALPSLFVSREITIKENLWFDDSLQLAADWDWVIRLAKTGCKFGYLNRYLGMHRIHNGQASRVKLQTMHHERHEICRRYGMSYPLLLVVDRVLGYPSVVLKALWILRTKGIKNLIEEVVRWLRRPKCVSDSLLDKKQ